MAKEDVEVGVTGDRVGIVETINKAAIWEEEVEEATGVRVVPSTSISRMPPRGRLSSVAAVVVVVGTNRAVTSSKAINKEGTSRPADISKDTSNKAATSKAATNSNRWAINSKAVTNKVTINNRVATMVGVEEEVVVVDEGEVEVEDGVGVAKDRNVG